MDFTAIEEQMQGCYGVFVNTDGEFAACCPARRPFLTRIMLLVGWVEGPANELYAGIKLFEIANRVGVKHFIYSGIPYTSKVRSSPPRSHLLLSGMKIESDTCLF